MPMRNEMTLDEVDEATPARAPDRAENGTGSNGNYPPRLTFYHPNGQGTGAAAQFDLKLEGGGDHRGGCLFMSMARQASKAGTDNGARTPATFDWTKRATVKLDFSDLCEMLVALEGRAPQAGGDKGLYHQSAQGSTIITLRRREEGGFLLGLSRKDSAGEISFRHQLALTEAESTGLRCVLQAVLLPLAFRVRTS
jgi:hypothetical protein